MIIAGLVLAALAAAIHVYIFVLESIAWSGPAARRTFGTTDATVEVTKPLAFNQGFYNLFLAIAVVLGIVVTSAGEQAVGATLVFTGTGSMVAAGLVLLLSDRAKARAALIQLTPPLLAIVLLVIGLVA
jgi:putative membrane protein